MENASKAYLHGILNLSDSGTITYTSKDKSILVVADFAEPMVELKMTGVGENPATLTEYYDNMYQAYTRMTNLVNAGTTTWDTAVITPLKANANDNTVYYYGSADAGAKAQNTLNQSINVSFDLNSFTLDLAGVGRKELSNYSLTLKNGTVISHVGETDSTDTCQFDIQPGGELALKNATLTAEKATYSVIVRDKKGTEDIHGALSIDHDSHAGKVLLEGDNTHVLIPDLAEWTEYDENTKSPAATLYVDLAKLVTSRTKKGADGQIVEGTTTTERQVLLYSMNEAARESTNGHAVRTNFVLADAVTAGETDQVNDAPFWFITTTGYLYPRVQDLIPQLVCQSHPEVGGDPNIRTERPADAVTGEDKEYTQFKTDGTPLESSPYYPVYYVYERNYGYNNRNTGDDFNAYGNPGHPLSIVTTLRDAFGNVVHNTAGGIVTVSMAHVSDGVKNRLLTARVQVGSISRDGEGTYAIQDGIAVYTGTDANPRFPASDRYYYLSGSFTGIDEYASNYSRYWKVQDEKRADLKATSLSGSSKLKINEKPLADGPVDRPDTSVRIISVTPGSATFIGAEGAKQNLTSRAATVRVQDTNTSMNLTSGDDLQNYYRKLVTKSDPSYTTTMQLAGTVEVTKDDGTTGTVTYYYANDIYYTATGAWYGIDMFNKTENMTDELMKRSPRNGRNGRKTTSERSTDRTWASTRWSLPPSRSARRTASTTPACPAGRAMSSRSPRTPTA